VTRCAALNAEIGHQEGSRGLVTILKLLARECRKDARADRGHEREQAREHKLQGAPHAAKLPAGGKISNGSSRDQQNERSDALERQPIP